MPYHLAIAQFGTTSALYPALPLLSRCILTEPKISCGSAAGDFFHFLKACLAFPRHISSRREYAPLTSTWSLSRDTCSVSAVTAGGTPPFRRKLFRQNPVSLRRFPNPCAPVIHRISVRCHFVPVHGAEGTALALSILPALCFLIPEPGLLRTAGI